MSDHDSSVDMRSLTSRGLSNEETELITDFRQGGNRLRHAFGEESNEPNQQRLFVFWMAIGVSILLVIGRTLSRFSQSIIIHAVGYSAAPDPDQIRFSFTPLITCALFGLFVVYVVHAVAKGRFAPLTQRLARRYASAGLIRRDVVLLFFAVALLPLLYELIMETAPGPFFWHNFAMMWELSLYYLYKEAIDPVCVMIMIWWLWPYPKNARKTTPAAAPAATLDSMFQGWRNRLVTVESMRQEDVLELEEHMKDEMAGLTGMGLSEQEAFLIAAQRTGTPEDLAREFDKVQPNVTWNRRAYAMLSGIIFFYLFQLVFRLLFAVPFAFVCSLEKNIGAFLLLFVSSVPLFWACFTITLSSFANGRCAKMADRLAMRHRNAQRQILDLITLVLVYTAMVIILDVVSAPHGMPLMARFNPVLYNLLGSSPPVLLMIFAVIGLFSIHPRRSRPDIDG